MKKLYQFTLLIVTVTILIFLAAYQPISNYFSDRTTISAVGKVVFWINDFHQQYNRYPTNTEFTEQFPHPPGGYAQWGDEDFMFRYTVVYEHADAPGEAYKLPQDPFHPRYAGFYVVGPRK